MPRIRTITPVLGTLALGIIHTGRTGYRRRDKIGPKYHCSCTLCPVVFYPTLLFRFRDSPLRTPYLCGLFGGVTIGHPLTYRFRIPLPSGSSGYTCIGCVLPNTSMCPDAAPQLAAPFRIHSTLTTTNCLLLFRP